MTYCFAWKSNNEIYIVADSLTSSKSSEIDIESEFSSMGERYGEYNSYFIAEADTKIYTKGSLVIAFSGDMEIFNEVKEKLVLLQEHLQIDETISYLKGILGDSEIILALKQKGNNELFLVNKREVKIINDFVSIGSGQSIEDLENVMLRFVQTFPDFDDEDINDIQRKKISATTAFLQTLSIKNNFLDYGVGGTVHGICIHENKVEWNDDLLYFIYDENFKVKKLINMLIRKDTILTGSDFTGLTKLFRLPETANILDEVDIRKLKRSMNKNISSHIPRYIVYYSRELNNIHFYDTHRKTQTTLVKMFQRRSNVESRWEIYTNPFLVSEFLLNYNNKEDFVPQFNYLNGFLANYDSREKMVENTENIEDIDFAFENFDYPLENIQINFKIENYFTMDLEEYENLIIVNFDFLANKILELRNFYNGLNVQFDSSKILKELCSLLKREWDLDNFEILVFSNQYQIFYEKIEGLELILTTSDGEFYKFGNKLIHNYYTDSRYFHLNKVFIIDDSSAFNELLEILPDYNRNVNETDIIMIKNQNLVSEVQYEPYYYNVDFLFCILSGLSYEALGLWNPSEYSEEELKGIQNYLNVQLDNART